jgi:hypothetical protein
MSEASSAVFDRWLAKADRNIGEWGLQDEETLLLAMQEELGGANPGSPRSPRRRRRSRADR